MINDHGITAESMRIYSTVMQSQKAVTVYLKSEQLLPFGFARQTPRATGR